MKIIYLFGNLLIWKYYFYILQPLAEGRLLDIVDNKWREDKLPFDQILVPYNKLPDPEADGADCHLTLFEQVSNFTLYPDVIIFKRNISTMWNEIKKIKLPKC